MATAKQTIEAALRGEGCLGKADPDEPVFVLRAQDIHAADLVERWAHWGSAHQLHGDKAREALEIAADMRAWPKHKQPD